ncbi:hypothetical protein LTS18_003673, partial [Coniosporium uncinatum]
IEEIDDALQREREGMRALFAGIDDAVGGVAAGAADGLIEEDGSKFGETEMLLVNQWGERWARAFRRKGAVEETVVGELAVAAKLAAAEVEEVEMVENGDENGVAGTGVPEDQANAQVEDLVE